MFIGQSVIEWNQAERNLLRLMAMLRLHPPRPLSDREYSEARDFWLDQNSEDWVKELNRLARNYSQASFAPNLKAIIKAYPVAMQSRHNIVHGYYGGMNDLGKREFKRKPRKMPQYERLIDALEVSQWLNDIRILLSEIGTLEVKINKNEYSL